MASLCDDDFAFALQLQQQYDKEICSATAAGQKGTKELISNECEHKVTDDSLELFDPTPDIFVLFQEFDRIYFMGKLTCCEVKWSPRMTLCAGLCHYEGRGGLCSIRLSAPLLKLRPRKDLVQTLLHEMIHAYLFVTQNNKDHDAHGPEFLKHMHRINKLSGANITVYHSFHDEVDTYRQHWWQCDGPCKNRRPYYGLVKRAMNRAPGPNDKWWDEHKKSCNGTFVKIRGPEMQSNKQKRMLKNEPFSPGSQKAKVSGTAGGFQPFNGKGHVLCKGSSPFKNKPTNPRENIENFLKRVENKNNTANTPMQGLLKSKEAETPRNNVTKLPVKPTAMSHNKIKQQRLDSYLALTSSNTTSVMSSKQQSSKDGASQGLSDSFSEICPANDNLIHENSFIDVFLSGMDDDVEVLLTSPSMSTKTMQCPVCQNRIQEKDINSHLDQCVS